MNLETTHVLSDKFLTDSDDEWQLVVPKIEPLDEPPRSSAGDVGILQPDVEPEKDDGVQETGEPGKHEVEKSQTQHKCMWISLDTLKICAAVYPTISQLHLHVKKHVTGSKCTGYTCWWQGCINECHPFKEKDTLVNHLFIHTNELSRKNYKDHEEQESLVCKVAGCNLKFARKADFEKHGTVHETVIVQMVLRNTYTRYERKTRSQGNVSERNTSVLNSDVNTDVLEILRDDSPVESTERVPLVVPKIEPPEDDSPSVSMDGSDSEIDLPDRQILEPKTEPVEGPEDLNGNFEDEVGGEGMAVDDEALRSQWNGTVGYKTKMEPEVIINMPQLKAEEPEESDAQRNRKSYSELSESQQLELKICRWVSRDTLQMCGKTHATLHELSTHVPRLEPKGYTCWWHGCGTDGHPFIQRDDLLFHLYSHAQDTKTLETDWSPIPEPSSSGVSESDLNECKFPGCNQIFARKADLDHHQKSHRTMLMRQKPYQCIFVGCGRRFGNQSILKEHIASHPVMKEVSRQPWRESAQSRSSCSGHKMLDLNVNLQPQVVLERIDAEKVMAMDTCEEMEREVERIRAKKQRTPVKIPDDAYQICKWEGTRRGMKGKPCLQVIATPCLVSHIVKEHLVGCTEHVCLWQNCQLGEHVFRLRLELLSHLRQHLLSELSRCPKRLCGQWFDTKRELHDHIVNGHTRGLTSARKKGCVVYGGSSRLPNTVSADAAPTNNCVRFTACNVPNCKKVTANCLLNKHVVGYMIMCKFPGCNRTFWSKKEFESHGKTHPTISLRRFERGLGRKKQDDRDLASNNVAKKMKPEVEPEEKEVDGREVVETTEKSRACVQMCMWTKEGNAFDVCLKVFPIDKLMDHVVKVHVAQTISERNDCLWLNCEEYGKQFRSRGNLVSHVRCHGFDEKFRCTAEHCRRLFSCQLDLERHIVCHRRMCAAELQRMARTRAAARGSRATETKYCKVNVGNRTYNARL